MMLVMMKIVGGMGYGEHTRQQVRDRGNRAIQHR
jgi:hypothetical protein